MDEVKALNELIAEDPIVTSNGRITGPIYGGELQLDMFGVCVHSGDSAIARFYNGRMTETKRLVEVINGKIYIRDERYG